MARVLLETAGILTVIASILHLAIILVASTTGGLPVKIASVYSLPGVLTALLWFGGWLMFGTSLVIGRLDDLVAAAKSAGANRTAGRDL